MARRIALGDRVDLEFLVGACPPPFCGPGPCLPTSWLAGIGVPEALSRPPLRPGPSRKGPHLAWARLWPRPWPISYIHTYIHTYIPAHVHTYSQPAGQPASQLVSWPARQTHGQTYVRTTYTGVAVYIYPTFGKPRCTFWNVDDSRLDERTGRPCT